MQAYYETILLKKKNNQVFVESCYFLKRVGGVVWHRVMYICLQSLVLTIILFGSKGLELGINNYYHLIKSSLTISKPI